MRTLILIATLPLIALLPAHAGKLPQHLHNAFDAARTAYDQGQADAAIQHYQTILDAGYVAPELLYNLANAHHLNQQPGHAIHRYRQALLLAPGDPEINANLNFVLNQTQAIHLNQPFINRLTTLLPTATWAAATLAAWWIAAALLALWALRRHPTPLRLGILLLIIAALTACAWWVAHQQNKHTELVIVTPSTEVKHAPLDHAERYFTLTEGSSALLQSAEGAWYKITSQGKTGYIPRSDCALVNLNS